MLTPFRPHTRATERGVSLYTLLAAVVVLGVITATLVATFSGENSKGQALLVRLQNISNSVIQFHQDTGCYPSEIEALWDYGSAKTNNSCGVTLGEGVWHGPYMLKQPTDSNGLSLHGYGAKAYIALGKTSGDRDVYAAKLPAEVAQAALDACGGSASACSGDNLNASTAVAGIHYVYQ